MTKGCTTLNIEIFKNEKRDSFIEDNKEFIYKTAYNVCKKNLSWENDDELSISLIAFNNACNTYNQNKGDFYAYAKIIIRNALVDYFRKSSNTPHLIFDSEDDTKNYIDYKASMEQYNIICENNIRAEEIKLFSKELKQYGLSFEILVQASPSHKDTRESLLNIAFMCSKNEEILNYIKTKKILPIKLITALTGAKKKLLEKWRRYIFALILILSSSEYPYIRSYLNIKAGESNDQNRYSNGC